MVRETEVTPRDLVAPLFVIHGRDVRNPIGSMPGVSQLSVEHIVTEAKELWSLGVPSVILFGIPEAKDAVGTSSHDDDGPVASAVRALKDALPEMVVMTDVCLCEYTDHGHCGLLRTDRRGHVHVDNDPTLDVLANEALCHARAGADVVAPSDMMDGRVGAIRRALDEGGFADVALLSYAVKYASGFYGPFRDAAGSTPAFGDRRAYQMDPANAREAIREALLDVEEGADMLMVKPALPYLDVLARVRDAVELPLAAYNVSGEYAMIKAAAANGWLDETRVVKETLTAIKRAGADIILTYHAKDFARSV